MNNSAPRRAFLSFCKLCGWSHTGEEACKAKRVDSPSHALPTETAPDYAENLFMETPTNPENAAPTEPPPSLEELCTPLDAGTLVAKAAAEAGPGLNAAMDAWASIEELNRPPASQHCRGEHCSMCGAPAASKVAEEILHDDPMPNRHPYTAYLCGAHFAAVLFGRNRPGKIAPKKASHFIRALADEMVPPIKYGSLKQLEQHDHKRMRAEVEAIIRWLDGEGQ